MARLDVFALPGGTVLALDVQADLLSHLATRTVVPLLPAHAAPKPISALNPVFEIAGERHVMITQGIASVPVHELKHKVASLPAEHDAIVRALDVLLLGF